MLVCVVLLASGCGKDEPKRSALAESLAQLCEQARADTEALGLPAEKGFDVMKPTAARGLRLAADIKKLKGTTPAEKEQIASLAEYFRFYYNELDAAVKLYAAGQPEVYAITLVAGEALARERRGARDAHGRARVRRAAVPDRYERATSRRTRACASRRTPRRPRGSRASAGAARRRALRARARRAAGRRTPC